MPQEICATILLGNRIWPIKVRSTPVGPSVCWAQTSLGGVPPARAMAKALG